MPAPIIHLPPALDASFVQRGLGALGWGLPDPPVVWLSAKAAPPEYVGPLALVALAAWATAVRAAGCRIQLHDSLKTPYLSRTGLLQALASDAPEGEQVEERPEYLPLCRFRSTSQAERTMGKLAQVLHLQQVDAVQAVNTALRELGINAAEHGRSEHGAWVAAGYFPGRREVLIAVADLGVGIPAHIGQKGLLAPEDDDARAIEKAVQYRITGAGEPGVPEAPDNGGIGLHLARCYAQSCRGELRIHSLRGLFIDQGRDTERLGAAESRWPGTLVSLLLRPDQLNKHRGLPFPTAVSGAGVRLRQGPGPAGALVLRAPVDAQGFAADKAWCIAKRPALWEQLRAGGAVCLDFNGATYTLHSAVNALLGAPLREGGRAWAERIWVHNTRGPIEEILQVVLADALLDHQRT